MSRIPTTPRRPARARGESTPAVGDREMARLARALAHPARVAILRLLIERGDCICGQIVDRLPLAQATVSQHLKVLKEAGLIQGEVDGPRVCYCVNAKAVNRFKELIEGL